MKYGNKERAGTGQVKEVRARTSHISKHYSCIVMYLLVVFSVVPSSHFVMKFSVRDDFELESVSL